LKNENGVAKLRVKPKSNGTLDLKHKQYTDCMTNWPFYSICVMPWDRMFDWQHNSSSRSVAARISVVK